MSEAAGFHRREARASDADREATAARIRDAHVEGRLSAEEFNRRLDDAYQAQTYGELEPLVRDLPISSASPAPHVPTREVERHEAKPGPTGGDKAMRVLWTIWLASVLINLVVWVLVSVTNGELTYFWPIWVAGPAGATLLSVEIIRRIARD
jgi:uncharacterized integral membrane protein